MNRWMTAVAVAAGGGALIAMSAAHAALSPSAYHRSVCVSSIAPCTK